MPKLRSFTSINDHCSFTNGVQSHRSSIVMNVKTLLLSCDLYLQTSTKLGMIYSVTNQLSRKFGNLETGLFDWTQIGKKGWSSKKGIVIKLVYVFKSIDYAWQYFAQSMSQHCIFFFDFLCYSSVSTALFIDI